jgi:acetyltransferase-like isoleucine patch superfamily enzyme
VSKDARGPIVNFVDEQRDMPDRVEQSADASLASAAAMDRPTPRKASFVLRAFRLLRGDLLGSRPVLLFVQLFLTLIPRMAFGWLRPAVYRLIGVRIGPQTRIYGKMEIEGVGDVLANVSIGAQCLLTTPIYLNASGEIRIGDCVTLGHHVVVITDDHRMDDPERRGGERFSRPVIMEAGVWVGARATILPGVTLGRGCVVAAGSLVNRDVPAHTLVGGVPARRIKDLPR